MRDKIATFQASNHTELSSKTFKEITTYEVNSKGERIFISTLDRMCFDTNIGRFSMSVGTLEKGKEPAITHYSYEY